MLHNGHFFLQLDAVSVCGLTSSRLQTTEHVLLPKSFSLTLILLGPHLERSEPRSESQLGRQLIMSNTIQFVYDHTDIQSHLKPVKQISISIVAFCYVRRAYQSKHST